MFRSWFVVLCLGCSVVDDRLESIGRVEESDLREISGIVASPSEKERFWVHNDSGNPAEISLIGRKGKVHRTVKAPFVNIDWEDIAVDANGRLYLGDIGNNRAILPLRAIHRFAEPEGKKIEAVETCRYGFGTGMRFDCESLFVIGDFVHLISKRLDGRPAVVYRLRFDPKATLVEPAIPERLGELERFVEPATGADLSRDGRRLAVCAESVTRIYEPDASPSGWKLIGEIRYGARRIEAIAWDGDDLLLTDEPGRLFRIEKKEWSKPIPAVTSGQRLP
ncbi:MAG: hypothetical protein SFX72_21055 [Isosphaeraceae bacterium]|nr:hypothetical protein [Isosphaeraceae bacterium]